MPYESCKSMVFRWTISLARARHFLPSPLYSTRQWTLIRDAPSSDLILTSSEPSHCSTFTRAWPIFYYATQQERDKRVKWADRSENKTSPYGKVESRVKGGGYEETLLTSEERHDQRGLPWSYPTAHYALLVSSSASRSVDQKLVSMGIGLIENPFLRQSSPIRWLRARAFVPTYVFFQRLTILWLFPTWRWPGQDQRREEESAESSIVLYPSSPVYPRIRKRPSHYLEGLLSAISGSE
ncbi:hypothetical protein NW769_000500 [Fusarium oxysporum]|nr:hypothetical protein NW769_000500 [Fusarium oxysporum]